MRPLPEPPTPQPTDAIAPLSMIGPDGRIDPKTRARVSAKLMELGEDNLLAQTLLAMEAAGGGPLIAGNRARLLVDGPSTYEAMFSAISAARESVNIEMYIFDEAQHEGRKLSDLLAEVVAKGVAVNVLYDGLGSSATPDEVWEKLRAVGVRLCEFNPINPADNRTAKYVQRDHRKIVVVDGLHGFAGGINFSSAYTSGSRGGVKRDPVKEGWRDTQVEVEGPVSLELQRLFLGSWDKQKCPDRQPANYLPPAREAGKMLMRVDATTVDSTRNETYVSALSALTFAQKSIDLTMAYFSPDDQVEDALLDAADRGVRVRLLLPGLTDFSGIMHAGRAHYTKLLKGGVQIFEQQEVLLHSKTLEVDGIWSSVGSANWDWRSFANNDELNIVIIDEGFAREMLAMFESDLAAAAPITLDEWKKRPFKDKFLQTFWVLWERLL